jgi:hypothetical protein
MAEVAEYHILTLIPESKKGSAKILWVGKTSPAITCHQFLVPPKRPPGAALACGPVCGVADPFFVAPAPGTPPAAPINPPSSQPRWPRAGRTINQRESLPAISAGATGVKAMIETQLLSIPNPVSDRSGATVLSQRVPALEVFGININGVDWKSAPGKELYIPPGNELIIRMNGNMIEFIRKDHTQ